MEGNGSRYLEIIRQGGLGPDVIRYAMVEVDEGLYPLAHLRKALRRGVNRKMLVIEESGRLLDGVRSTLLYYDRRLNENEELDVGGVVVPAVD